MDIATGDFSDLDPTTLYGILHLRAEVFVVEQKCFYLDLDGRDLEPTTVHCWVSQGEEVIGYLRVLTEPDGGHRISRVAVSKRARRQGYASALVEKALGLAGPAVVASVQSHLVAWYTARGFAVDGPEFVEDGIPHTPMRRAG